MATESRAQKQAREIQHVLSTTQDEPSQIDAIANIRGWFQPQELNTSYPFIQEYVLGRCNLEDTLKEFTGMIDTSITTKRFKDVNLMDLWYSVIHSAKRIPYQDAEGHSKLVAFLKGFKEHPDPTSGSQDFKYSELTDFGMASREAYNDSPYFNAGIFAPENHAWANFNYFLARVVQDDVSKFYHFAIWALRQGLETPYKDEDEWAQDTGATAVQSYDAYVPAAAAWVFGLGKKLYEKEEDLTPKSRNEGNPGKGGELWTGGAEFSKARWAFWKSRLEEVSKMEGVKQETRDVAQEAVEAMNKAESSR